jgi:hypothetical protein
MMTAMRKIFRPARRTWVIPQTTFLTLMGCLPPAEESLNCATFFHDPRFLGGHDPRLWGPPPLGTPAFGDPRLWGPPLLGTPRF